MAAGMLLAACGTPAANAGSGGRTSGTTHTSTTPTTPGTGTTTTTTTTTQPTSSPGSGSQPVATATGATTSEEVGITTCPTAFANASTTTVPPASTAVAIPAALAGKVGPLTFYEDAAGIDGVLAPSGWSCSAVLAEDGSGSVTVVPPSESGSLPGSVALPSDTEVIEIDQTGACAGCTYQKVCGLFPQSAPRVYLPTPSFPCRADLSPAEAVDRLGTTAVAFEDPAGVKGTGVLSGGPNPANGVLTFVPTVTGKPPPGPMTYEATCTLPDAQHSLCTAVLDAFLARYGSK